MESLIVYIFHFFIMGSFIVLMSGVISFFFKGIPVFLTLLISLVAGYIYSILLEIPNLTWFAVVFNGILSILAIGLVKIGLILKTKAEELN